MCGVSPVCNHGSELQIFCQTAGSVHTAVWVCTHCSLGKYTLPIGSVHTAGFDYIQGLYRLQAVSELHAGYVHTGSWVFTHSRLCLYRLHTGSVHTADCFCTAYRVCTH